MSASGDEMQELLQDFVTESREHLATIESDLLLLEQEGEADVVNRVFRCVHTIKGVAGFLGLGRINDLAHAQESALDLVRNAALEPSAQLVEILLESMDCLRLMIEDVTNSNEVDIATHVGRLQAIIAARVEREDASPPAAASEGPSSQPAPATDAVTPESAPADASKPGAGSPAPAKRSKATPFEATPETIRVSVDLLDKLMNLSGELVLGRNQLLQALNTEGGLGLDVAASCVDHVVSDIQEAIMQTRMQPVGNLLQRFPRVVRDLAARLGKKCNLKVEGKEVGLDRTILEALGDPLTHIVRNSVDHGIERPEVRTGMGKPEVGTIRIRAFHQAGNVRILIEDDGGGIDSDRIRSKAIENGVISEEVAGSIGDREALMLIFAPGFSTAEKVTDVSGRGVGMDVVRTNIERLGGSVDLDSKKGEGSCISITLPLTLAILPALVATCMGRRYVVAQANVSELVRIRGAELAERISAVDGREVLRLRGNLLPVVRLREVLGLEMEARDDERVLNLMIVESGPLQYAMVVDAPPDAEEIVVKPLSAHLKRRPEYAGATILGDGRVAMILDVVGVASVFGIKGGESADLTRHQESLAKSARDTTELVLFRNHPDEIFAVPLGLISRIQRLELEELRDIGESQVLEHGERVIPLVRLEDVIAARRPEAESERLSVLVITVGGREVGIIAQRVDDVRAVDADVDRTTLRSDGVLGSFHLDGGTVRMLDVVQIAQQAAPHMFEGFGRIRGDSPVKVLFAEDSAFFRGHVRDILSRAGFEVTAVEDGDLAWRALKDEALSYDCVLTDIEMPNCDGLELTRRIRGDKELRDLPVCTLTSLSRPQDERRGLEAGVTAYRVKLDDEALIKTIWELVGVAV